MRFALKVLIALALIIFAAQIAKKNPSLAGLIAVMPLTGLVVLIWIYMDNPGNFAMMAEYTKGALFGIVPTMLFFVTAFLCFKKQLFLPATVFISFAIWFLAAVIHQQLLHK